MVSFIVTTPVVRPGDEAVRAWCAAHTGAAGAMTGADRRELGAAFADLYRWIHESWSPVGSGAALAEVSAGMVSDLDDDLSSGVWRGDRLVAAAFVFRDGARLECVAETMRRDEPDGIGALGAAVARTLTAAAAAGIAAVEFDGHDSDAHLAPLVATLPAAYPHPLLLVALP